MSDYNYIITIDENGSPCLSHALFGGGGNTKGSQRQNHKYYARAQDKGRWRYFYSPEEFRVWSSGGIKKVKNAVTDAVNKSGIKQRKALSDANKQTGLLSGLKRRQAQNAYNKTAMGRAEKAVRDAADDIGRSASEATKTARKKIKNLTDAVQEHGNKALSELREAAGNVRDKAEGAARDAGARARKAVEDKSGVTDQKNREEARRRALMGLDDSVGDYADSDNRYQKSAKGRADKAVAGAKNAAGRARDAAEEAGDRVRDTAGRARDAAENLRGRASEAAGNARERASAAADSVADKASDIRDRIRGLADSAGSAARNAAGRARDAASEAASRAQNAVGEATGTNAKKEMDAQGRKAMMGLDDAIGSFVDAQTRYDNSVAGRTASAKSNAEASLKSAQSAAKKALAKAMDYLPEEQIEEIKELIRGK